MSLDIHDALAGLDCSILAHPDRRQIVQIIDATTLGHDARWFVPDLMTEAGFGERKRILCHHIHLPKLVDHNVLEWGPATDHVQRGRRFGEAVEYLRHLETSQRDDSIPANSVDSSTVR